MHWILIIFMTSPGGDFVGKQELFMESASACKRAIGDIKNSQDVMGIRYHGKCVRRDNRGVNVGNEALD